MRRAVLTSLASLSALCACTSTSTISRHASAEERALLNQRLEGHAALVALEAPMPPAIVCERVELGETTLKVLRGEPYRDTKAVPYDAVRTIKVRDYGQGGLEGALLGLAVGGVAGAVAMVPRALATACAVNCAADESLGKGTGVLLGAGAGVLVGGVIGYLTGKWLGHDDVIVFTGFAAK